MIRHLQLYYYYYHILIPKKKYAEIEILNKIFSLFCKRTE